MSPDRPSNFAHIPIKVGEQSAVHVREPVEADTPNRLKAEVLALPRGEAFWCKEASIVPNLFKKNKEEKKHFFGTKKNLYQHTLESRVSPFQMVPNCMHELRPT